MQPVLALLASHKHKENDMGQFKPMVKMETTEPSVELKLKKGGKVAKKADGGMMGSPMSAAGAMPPSMPARGGMMGAKAPMKPSLAMRRRAMRGRPSGAGPAGPVGGAAQMQPSMPSAMPPPMKKGGKADTAQDKAMVKKAFKQHDMQEHKGGKGTKLKLKHGGKMATGGVTNGQGGFKSGGMTKKMATGGVVKGQGGYATGGVAKSNGGGYKEGGATKKAYAAGGTVNSGRPVAMPQGNKKPSQPVSINQLSGTFKKGGKVRKMAMGGNPELTPEDQQREQLVADKLRQDQNSYYGQGNVESIANPQSIEFPARSSSPPEMPNPDQNGGPSFTMDPGFQEGPTFQNQQPLSIYADFFGPHAPQHSPEPSGLTDFEKNEFDRKLRPSMPGDGRPPMPGRVDETGFLPPGPARDFYRGLISREEMDSRLASTPYKAGGRVAPIKRMTGGRSVKC
jgi:hypothetical protein